jgi:hypothetical protein
MKNLFRVVFLFFILISIGCSTKKRTGETVSTKPASQGLIEVTASGYGYTKASSVENAIENAFKNILTQGIPKSNQVRPLLGNNALSVFERNKKYFDTFFRSEVSKYILDQKILKYNPLANSQASTEVRLEINLEALRKKLESDNIISKFGI